MSIEKTNNVHYVIEKSIYLDIHKILLMSVVVICIINTNENNDFNVVH